MVKESTLGKTVVWFQLHCFRCFPIRKPVLNRRPSSTPSCCVKRYHLSEPNHYNGDVSVCPGYVESMPSRWMGWNDSGDDGVEVVVVAAVVVVFFLIHPDWFMLASWCQQNYLMVFIAWYPRGWKICVPVLLTRVIWFVHTWKIKQCTCIVNLIDAPFMLHCSGW